MSANDSNTQGQLSAGRGAAGCDRRCEPLAYLVPSYVFSEDCLSVPGRASGLLRRTNRISDHQPGQAILVLRVGIRDFSFGFL
jgi:hypothetical protein